jgi:cation transport protein ChaC
MDENNFWIFGYGSLMWNPGFPHIDKQQAGIKNAHRSLCIYSWVHRGTEESPGLVLGLDNGGSCEGIAFKVAPEHQSETLQYLRERELVTNVYQEVIRTIEFKDGTQAEAVSYMVDCQHEQYAGRLSVEELIKQTSGAVGQSGDNESYVYSTVEHLRTMGICDEELEAVYEGLKKLEKDL